MTKTFLVIGGYGNTGRAVARLLAEETNARVVLAGRDAAKAEEAARALNRGTAPERVSGRRVDAADPASLAAAFDGVDLVVSAAATAGSVPLVADAAIRAGIDYLDTQISAAKLETLRALRGRIEDAGCCFVTDAGYQPGLPAAAIRAAALRLDRLETARAASLMALDWDRLHVSDATMTEMVELLADTRTAYFRDGAWTAPSLRERRTFDFGNGFGERACSPMFLDEMTTLPELLPGLLEAGFHVAGFNPFVDYLAIPLAIAAVRVAPRPPVKRAMGRLLVRGLRTFGKPPYGTVLRVDATGTKAGAPARVTVRIAHEDGYALTALCVVACLRQYADGDIGEPGLWQQALVVDPVRMLDDLARMGASVDVAGPAPFA